MKTPILTTCIFLILSLLLACQSNEKVHQAKDESNIAETQSTFDSLTAARYGADQYGMKKYVFAVLKRGPNREQDSVKSAELQKAHLENVIRLAEEGKLVLSGPFFDDGDSRGIYIFNVESIEEAERLTNTDPAIQAGSLVMELREWYGTAALVSVYDKHKTLTKKDITEHK